MNAVHVVAVRSRAAVVAAAVEAFLVMLVAVYCAVCVCCCVVMCCMMMSREEGMRVRSSQDYCGYRQLLFEFVTSSLFTESCPNHWAGGTDDCSISQHIHSSSHSVAIARGVARDGYRVQQQQECTVIDKWCTIFHPSVCPEYFLRTNSM